ncbi:calcium binding protein [Anaeramoeba ignava]|uniref:Calcium binding protein n=1 Tax=Anaeramoeba ignava TaxID=1746090 RepID=A0A9Q0LSR0_ANAIG|nr:calcium binding protein [Anaeramoeba ignava]
MGSNSTKKKSSYVSTTNYHQNENKTAQNDFDNIANGKFLSKSTFANKYLSLVSNNKENLFTNQILKVFSDSSQINKPQFSDGFAKFTQENRDEQIKLVFSIFDIDGDGYLTQNEFTRMIECFFEVNLEKMGKIANINDESKTFVQKFFKEVSPLLNDRISFNEYKQHSKKNQSLANNVKNLI